MSDWTEEMTDWTIRMTDWSGGVMTLGEEMISWCCGMRIRVNTETQRARRSTENGSQSAGGIVSIK